MKTETYVAYVFFLIFRYYKRHGMELDRKHLKSDMRCIRTLLSHIRTKHLRTIDKVMIDQMAQRCLKLGCSIPKLDLQISSISMDDEIVCLMLSAVKKICFLLHLCPRESNAIRITYLLMALHNLPRTFLLPGETIEEGSFYYMSKSEALTNYFGYMKSAKKWILRRLKN